MTRARKHYSRYYIVRDHQALWRGNPAEKGSHFRQILITSNEFNSTVGTFQVYALEGTGMGIKDGKFAGADDEPRVLFDEDFNGLEAAARKFDELFREAKQQGFHSMTLIDALEFEAKYGNQG